ncbi:unnamed protein product, partial [Laminaria digitata]
TGILVALGSAALFCGSIVAASALGFLPALEMGSLGVSFSLDLLALEHAVRMQWLAGGVASVLAGVILLAVTIRHALPSREALFVLRATRGDGATGATRVTLSHRGLTALITHMAESTEGVHDAHPTVSHTRQGWRVMCRVGVWGSVEIPEVSNNLQRVIQDGLRAHTGIEVANLEIRTQYEAV